MLWIALHLPFLSLETFAATVAEGSEGQPLALIDAHHIVSANAGARALGVQTGMKRATALALAPQLRLGQADAARDAQALTAVAHAALAFTPNVSIAPASEAVDAAPPHTVLLDVQASLRYFGGFDALRDRLLVALLPLGHRLHTVAAPTPLAATLLARLNRDLRCEDIDSARTALDASPVWLLGPGRAHWDALQGMGLQTLSDLRRLPRTGLARRFGEAVLDEFDRAFGHKPDPREPLALPPTFESRLELFARADTTEQVMHGAGMLLPRMVAWLSAHHAYASRFTLVMEHEPRWRASQTPAATPLEIALAEPSRDAAHLLVLMRERLARIELPAPTLELHLHCADISRRPPPNTELFPTPHSEQEGLTRLIERLQARLGPAQIQRLCEVEEHRPERATDALMAEACRFSRLLAAPGRGQKETSKTSPKKAIAEKKFVELKTVRKQGVDKKNLDKKGVERVGTGTKSAEASGNAAQRTTPQDSRKASHTNDIQPRRLPVRPVWLLPQAERLPEQNYRPVLDGEQLQLLSGPERIESGWWDGQLAERDYYIAQKADGALVWIYRSRVLLSTPIDGWFLQGRFG